MGYFPFVAQTSTLYRFHLELADIDRGVYESLDLRVACHASEDTERLVVRVLARALAHIEGLEFGRGLSHTEEPALWAKSLQGDIDLWIDVGCPSAERLHRASKASGRVMVFTDKPRDVLRKEWSSRTVHQAQDIEICHLSASMVAELAATLERNMQWYCTLQEGNLSVGDGSNNVDAPVVTKSLAALLAETD